MSIKRVKVLKEFDGHKAGEVVPVHCDEKGTPLERSWRRRLKDAKTDKCCEIVKKARAKGKPQTGDK